MIVLFIYFETLNIVISYLTCEASLKLSSAAAAAVVLVAVIGSSLHSADGATIRKRSADSAAALRSIADNVKALTKDANDAYVSPVEREREKLLIIIRSYLLSMTLGIRAWQLMRDYAPCVSQ